MKTKSISNFLVRFPSRFNNWFRQNSTATELISQINSEEVTVEVVQNTPNVAKVLKDRFLGIKPLETIFVKEEGLRINFLIPRITEESLFGGAATGLIFATILANTLKCPLRIVTTDDKCDLAVYFKLIDTFKLEAPCEVFSYDGSPRFSQENILRLEVSKGDIFISTIWWSSYIARKASIRKKFIYLIQEFEPVFYPNGDERLLVLESYNRYKDFIPVLNTSNLKKYFSKTGFEYVSKEGISFEPSFPLNFCKPSENSFKKKKKYKMFFYARPNALRNLYYRGIEILDLAIKKGIIDTEKWDIYFAGEAVCDFEFLNGYKPKMLGKLSYEQYSDFISTVDLGLSLMDAPHPSYPPLDLISAGAVVVTNNSEGKKDLDYCKNLLFSDIHTEKMVEKIKEGIELAQNYKVREANFKTSKLQREWSKSFAPIIERIKKELNENKL